MYCIRAEVKSIHKKMKLSLAEDLLQEGEGTRHLTELDLQIQPLDLVLSVPLLDTLTSFAVPLAVLQPPPALGAAYQRSGYELMSSLNNNTLPLVYLKADRFRVFLHQPHCGGDGASAGRPDFVLFQVGESRLTCQADNPLSRILVNDSIFYAAAEAGQLEVPGSCVEDRQYQLDLNKISLYTGVWRVSKIMLLSC